MEGTSETKKKQKAKHEGIGYPCDQCEHIATEIFLLKRHKEVKHEGISYPCDQCAYCATRMGDLKRHKKTKHEGIPYPCDQCEFSATDIGNLKRHKKVKHEGIRYPCDQCEYSATRIDILNKHRKVNHENCEYTTMQSGNKEVHHKIDLSSAAKKVKVLGEKLAFSKYRGYLEHVQEPEFIEVSERYEEEKEIKTEEDIDPLSIIDWQ